MNEIEISNGQNIIDIFFDDFASCLFVKKALAVNWPDCRGSIGEYYSISNLPDEERNYYTKTLNKVLSEGNDLEQIESVKDFLKIFGNGKYSINKWNAKLEDIIFLTSHNVIYSNDVPNDERFSGAFYPSYLEDSENCLFSITNDIINQDRVEYYCSNIKNGQRPTVITMSAYIETTGNHSCNYVLDGHHKIQAYLKLNENIPIIHIQKIEKNISNTASLLNYSKTFLKDFEYKHLFVNNGENLLNIDFINEENLTNDLDEILSNANKIDTEIINLLKKFCCSKNQSNIDWYKLRLKSLKKNKNLSLLAFGKVLNVYEKKKDERFGECWFPKVIRNNFELESWIKKTINNCA